MTERAIRAGARENKSAQSILITGDRGFGVMMGFGKRPAVIIIDIIRAFTDYKNPEMLLAANLDKEIEGGGRERSSRRSFSSSTRTEFI